MFYKRNHEVVVPLNSVDKYEKGYENRKKKKGSTPVNDVQLCQLKANLAEA